MIGLTPIVVLIVNIADIEGRIGESQVDGLGRAFREALDAIPGIDSIELHVQILERRVQCQGSNKFHLLLMIEYRLGPMNMPTLPIYMDNHATTRVDPRVVEAMLPYFTEDYGNAASRHHVFGRLAEEAVERARAVIAGLIGASAKEIVFTSGATESDNLAIKGVAAMYRRKGNHLITVVTEHHAVLDPCRRLEREGYEVTYLPVDRLGRISA